MKTNKDERLEQGVPSKIQKGILIKESIKKEYKMLIINMDVCVHAHLCKHLTYVLLNIQNK